MSRANQKLLAGASACCLIALAIFVWPTPHTYVQIHQDGHVQTVRENRVTGAIAVFNQQTKQWDNRDKPKQERASDASEISTGAGFAADAPDRHAERAFLDTAHLHNACLLADEIVHSGPEDRQFSRYDFQLAERCMAYVTGALDTLPGKVEIIGGRRYGFAFRNQKVLVGNAVDSFNRYVSTHPESVNWSGAETLEIALVKDQFASWLLFPGAPGAMMPTKTASEQAVLSESMK
jgi:hypothetical protein